MRGALIFKLNDRGGVEHNGLVDNWRGGYVGAFTGLGQFENDFFARRTFETGFDGLRGDGALFGGLAGYNLQFGRTVAGAEIGFAHTNIGDRDVLDLSFQTESLREEIVSMATARGRLGYAALPRTLLFVSAGLSWERVEETFGAVRDDGSYDTNTTPTDHFGWVAGLGVDLAISNGWIGRLEYLHHDFGEVQASRTTVAIPSGISVSNTADSHTVDEVRGAIIYRFEK